MSKVLIAASLFVFLSGQATRAEITVEFMQRSGEQAQRDWREDQRRKDLENNSGTYSSIGDTVVIAGGLAALCYVLGCFDAPKKRAQQR